MDRNLNLLYLLFYFSYQIGIILFLFNWFFVLNLSIIILKNTKGIAYLQGLYFWIRFLFSSSNLSLQQAVSASMDCSMSPLFKQLLKNTRLSI